VLLLAQLLAVTALIALGLSIAIVVRRATHLLAETRDIEQFRRTVADLAARIETSLDGVAVRVDGVRRHALAAAEVVANIEAAADAVERYAQEAQSLHGPDGAIEIREAIVLELGHAARALEMVDHGCAILAAATIGGRELEAQTAIKRGYLNILHAREALARHAARAAELGGTERSRLFARRNA
jgi:hypothetical protein